MEKSKNLSNQLKELKTEIEVLKIEDTGHLLDRLHDENVMRGENKYSTIRQVCVLVDKLIDFLFCLFSLVFYSPACGA